MPNAHLATRAASKPKTFRFKTAAVADDGTFSGYGSVFGVVDSYGDIVLPGAFSESLAAHAAEGRMPSLLWQHDDKNPIGVWTDMREDERGLWCEGRLVLEVQQAREAHALMKAGALDGLSIGYDTIEHEFGPYGGAGNYRLLKTLDLWEVSPVTFPACRPSRIEAVKSVAPPALRPEPIIAALRQRDAALALLMRGDAAQRSRPPRTGHSVSRR